MIASIRHQNDTPRQIAIKLILLLSLFVLSFRLLGGSTYHLILFVALGFIAYSLSYLIKYGNIEGWALHKGNITSISEEEYLSPLSNKRFVYPVISYEYSVNDKTCKSEIISVEKENIWKEALNEQGNEIHAYEKWWSGLKNHYELSVFVNPKKPAESVLINQLRSVRQAHHLSLLSSGVLLGFIYILLIILN